MLVILEGSTRGRGLFSVSMTLCHWGGRPTYWPVEVSNDVWTRCWKSFGAEISSRCFFFLRRNIATATERQLLGSESRGKQQEVAFGWGDDQERCCWPCWDMMEGREGSVWRLKTHRRSVRIRALTARLPAQVTHLKSHDLLTCQKQTNRAAQVRNRPFNLTRLCFTPDCLLLVYSGFTDEEVFFHEFK